jgi:hypothetical protein
MTNLNSSPTGNTTILYAVQRCWHSGPTQHQPLDYLRLFETQRDAEEAAYHSAHAFSRYVNNGRDVAIKTLLLPSYPAHNPQGSSYGFVASGALFWVRALKATIVTARHHNRMYFENQNICHTEAYVVLTEGVIGGTGNRNSRRGTEICEGRVFGGDASSHKVATDAMVQIQAQFAADQVDFAPPRHVEIKTLKIGKPSEYASGNFLQDWPARVLPPKNDIMDDAAVVDHKRHCDDEFWNTQEEEGMVVDCPFEVPSAKRRRFARSDENTFQSNGNHGHNSNDMFQGNGSGGLMVLRGGVFVGASTNGYNASGGGGGTNDIDMM